MRAQRHESPGRGAVLSSAAVHGAAVLLAWWITAVRQDVPDFLVYEINLISPPAAELGDPTPPPPEELVIETPQDVAPEPQEETPPPVVEEESPPPEAPEPEEIAAPPDPVPDEDPEPPKSTNPDPDVESPGEDLNVRMEGLRRDYPGYYDNIIRQMRRCFRWRGSRDLRATIYFVINRDGSVSDIDVLEASGSAPFDIEAMGAAECAGSRGRLGPLPEEWPLDRFRVKFIIAPQGGEGMSA